MEILFVSKSGDALPLAIKLADKHRVKFYVKKKGSRMGEGLVKMVPSWRPHLKSADFVIFDMVGLGSLADLMRRKDKIVLGGGVFNDLIELDRQKGTELMQKAGITVPETWSFKSVEEGKKFIKAKRDRYVLKPLGNQDTMWTYVAQMDDSKDLVYMMDTAPLPDGYELQKFIDGIEVSTEGWFDGEKFVGPFNHTMERKRFMDRDKGPSTGCMGNVVWFADGDKLVEQTLMKVQPYLNKMAYVGPIDINCIVTKDKAYGIEWTARFGYSALWALLECFDGDFATWSYGFAQGKQKEMPVKKDNWGVAVRLTVPPYPTDTEYLSEMVCKDWPLFFEDKAWPHIWLADAYRSTDGVFKVAGVDGVVMEVTAKSNILREARRRCYRTIDRVVLPNKQYRSDIGLRCWSDIPKLEEWGWIDLDGLKFDPGDQKD